jgi:putative transposase
MCDTKHELQGQLFDNTVIESFLGTLKAEYYYLAKPDGIEMLEAGIHDYIRYYNHKRIKLGLQGLSLVKYRLKNTD